jgi:hypothetical protein
VLRGIDRMDRNVRVLMLREGVVPLERRRVSGKTPSQGEVN